MQRGLWKIAGEVVSILEGLLPFIQAADPLRERFDIVQAVVSDRPPEYCGDDR